MTQVPMNRSACAGLQALNDPDTQGMSEIKIYCYVPNFLCWHVINVVECIL
jgi:hypothetical protein